MMTRAARSRPPPATTWPAASSGRAIPGEVVGVLVTPCRWRRPAPDGGPTTPSEPSARRWRPPSCPTSPRRSRRPCRAWRPTLRPGPRWRSDAPYTGAVTAAPVRLPPLTGCVVLIPVKAFGAAKARLAPTLDAAGTRRAGPDHGGARPRRRRPAAGGRGVRRRRGGALGRGPRRHGAPRARTRAQRGRGSRGGATRRRRGAARCWWPTPICPSPTRWPSWPGSTGVTLVPDRRDDGTNVVCVPTRAGFRFPYGPGSFARHRAEARASGAARTGWCATPSWPGTSTCPATSLPGWGPPARASTRRRP